MGSGKQGLLRIIAGQWRGRKLRFPAVDGLRPTPDRVRETLFNWLAPQIHDTRCLDLFCGSGALGLEALSRGAAQCTFIDSSRPAIEAIINHLHTLQCDQGRCLQRAAGQFLDSVEEAKGFDLVFLDPPFGAGLVDDIVGQLERNNWLQPDARIYVETAARDPQPAVPDNWFLQREKTAGDVCSRLFVRLQ